MIYSDGVHLISDVSVEGIHKYAEAIGIKRCWFHNGGEGRFPHYDIPIKRRKDFFKNHPDVKQVTSREIIAILNKLMQEK